MATWRSYQRKEVEPTGGPPAPDPTYRSPTEVVWPATKQQQKFASRMFTSLSAVLLHNATFKDRLVGELGFAVKEIRMSPDNLRAFILWDSFLGRRIELERELRKQAPKLRSALAHALRARNMPQLEFRHDSLTAQQQEVEDIFRMLEEQEEGSLGALDSGDEDVDDGSSKK